MIEELKSEGFNMLQALIHLVIAFVAGSMKGLHKIESKGFKFTSFVANAAVSSFVGVMFFFLSSWLEFPTSLCAAVTGIAGWMGGNLMDFLGLVLKKSVTNKLGTTITVEEEKIHSELINK